MENESKITTEELRQLFHFITKGYKIPENITDVLYNVAQREVEEKERVVLVKRDPNTTAARIQALYAKIIKDRSTIEIHPAQVGGWGADFDGDTVALYLPLSKESQQEAKDKMSSLTSRTSINSMNFEITKEMLTGVFTLTYTESKEKIYKKVKDIEEAKKLDISAKVEVKYNGKNVKTTVGRLIFNENLPKGYPFVDYPVGKGELKKILSEILAKSQKDFAETIDNVMKVSFLYSTIKPKTFALDQLEIPQSIKKLKDKLAVEKDLTKQIAIQDKMEELLLEHLKKTDNDLYYSIASGASKGTNQIRQVMVAKGIIADPQGNPLPPIMESFTDGYKPKSYFDAASGSRKGVMDRALNTAEGGYLYRKMIYVLGNVEADLNLGNCGTKKTLHIKLSKDLFKRLKGRYVLVNGKITPIDEKMIGTEIDLRSPVFCIRKKICRICYGDLIKQIATPNIGIVAAQEVGSLAERIMKSFHTGGAVLLQKPDVIKDIMNNLDDALEPKVRKYIKQDNNDIISTSDFMMLRIEKGIFKNEPIKKEDDFYNLTTGYFNLDTNGFTIPVTIEQPVKIYINNNDEEENKEFITLTYSKGEKIFQIIPKQEDFAKLAKEFSYNVGGKSPWNDVPSLYMKFWKKFAAAESYDSVHMETALSNILRWKLDPQIEARLKKPYNPTMLSEKSLPGVISWPLGLAFEDFSKAINKGLTSDRGPTSPVERLLYGETLTKK